MSFKDLEAEIKAWADLEKYAHAQKEAHKEAKRALKRDKKAKKARPPLFRPDAPIKYAFSVTMVVRDMSHRVWGDETETAYDVTDTISKDEAQVLAVKRANADGLAVVKVLTITRK